MDGYQEPGDPTKARVREVLARTGVSMRRASTEWLGRHHGFLEQTLGAKRPMTESELQRIAAGTGVDIVWFKTGREIPSPFSGPRDLPVRPATAVGGEGMPTDPEEFVERPAALAGVGRSFAVRMPDDRLRPRYRRNDLLYFHGGHAPAAEDCVALEQADGTYVVGILVAIGGAGITLKSLSPEQYETYQGALSIAREVAVLRA